MTVRFSGLVAIFAFFVVCVCGLLGGVAVEQVCVRAVVAMAVFYFIGLGVGKIANMILLDSVFGEEKTGRQIDMIVSDEAAVDEKEKTNDAVRKQPDAREVF